MKRITHRKRLVLGLAVVVVVLVVNSALSYRNTKQLYDDAGWVTHTRAVIGQIDAVTDSLIQAEDGYRGYVATASDSFLQPYLSATSRQSQQIATLREMTVDNPAQDARIDKLQLLVASYLQHLEMGVAIARNEGFPAARVYIGNSAGASSIDAVRDQANAIKTEEERLLAVRIGRQDATYGIAIATNLIVTAFGLLMVAAFVRTFERGLRKEAAAAAVIHDQRQLFHATLLSIGDGVIATDAEAHITLLNPVAQELTGWTAQDAIGKHLDNVFRIVNEETREAVDNPALRALREGRIVGLANHTVLISRDGIERPIDDSAAPIRTAGDGVSGAVLVFRDITEKHEIAAKLSEANKRNAETLALLDAVLAHAPVGIGFYDTDLRFVKLNDALAGISAQTRKKSSEAEELLLRPHADVVADLQHALDTGEAVVQKEIVRPFSDPSAGNQHLYVNIYPVRDPDGTMLGVGKIVMDVTTVRQAEKKLLASESRLRFVMESMPQKIFTAKPSGEIDYYNPQWFNFTGLEFEQIRDWGWTQFVHPDDIAENTRTWKSAIASGEPFQFEQRFRRADGQYRWHLSRAVALKDEHGAIVMWVGSNTDIDEERQTANELRQMAAQLSEADTRKDEFLATLAHELRNPLAPIRNGLNLMRSAGVANKQFAEVHAVMDRQLTHLVRLVDDLLDVSRISRGSIQLRKEPVAIADVIDNAVETSRSLIESMRHALNVTIPDRTLRVDADLTRLAQVFSNLLNNAAKYTDTGGRIVLAVVQDGSDAVVTVEDNGIGIPADKLGRIFDMFTQVDQSLEKSQSGLGIGLTLVRRLVEMHGGSVAAESAGAGLGSTFRVRLPITAQRDHQPPAAIAAPVARNSGLRVLVVDDNRDSADSLSMMLELVGHRIRTAYDGLEGVNAAREFRPEAILMDIGLPKLNGYEACRRIRDEDWSTGITMVAITGWGQEADRRRSQEAGFDRHMVKPIDPEALIALLAGIAAAPPEPAA